MRVAITGASGMIGRSLVAALRTDGHAVVRLVRRPDAGRAPDAAYWDPASGTIDMERLRDVDAVVHLAGESLVGVWTAAKKRRIRDSRVQGTALIARAAAALDPRPAALLSASASGWYGDRPAEEALDEESPSGTGFLAETARAWEAAASPAADAGVRVAYLRSGMVLTREGGALRPLLPLFRLGLGGRLGSGRQPWSWISLDDEIGAIRHVLEREDLAGPVNLVAPEATTNRTFTAALGRAVRRPTVFVAPGFALRLVAGEMAEQMLLGGQSVVPRRLLASGYRFRHPTLDQALGAIVA